MIHILALLFFAHPMCAQPVDPMTADDRRASYARVRELCDAEGIAPHVCEAVVAMAWRESRGMPHSVHTRGRNELGFGLFGHNPRFWRWLLTDGETFCDPDAATRALFTEFRYAYRRGARTVRDLQRVHAGRNPKDSGRPYKDARWCYLLEHGPRDDGDVVSWDADCTDTITCEDVGGRVVAGKCRAR